MSAANDPELRPQQEILLVAAALVWLADDVILVQRRAADALHGAGFWELPGGKVERGESTRAALARELHEEWGPNANLLRIGALAEILHHCYPVPGPEVHLVVFNVDARVWEGGAWKAQICTPAGVELGAFRVNALPLHQFLEADRPFLSRLSAMPRECSASAQTKQIAPELT